MTRLFRDVAIAAAVIVLLGTAFWTFRSVATVTARNATGQHLSAVTVGFTETAVWKGDLRVDDSKWTFGIPRQDGTVEISYTVGDTTHRIQCGYVSPGLGGAFVVEILPDGSSNCEESR